MEGASPQAVHPKHWQEADSLLPASPQVSSFSIEAPIDTGYLPQGGVEDPRRARLALYTSHALSAWGQRAWEFTVGLVLLEIRPNSLFLVAVFGLCDAGAQVALGPYIGTYIDTIERQTGASSMYALQNSMVALSAAASLFILRLQLDSGPWFAVLVVLAIAAGSLSSVGAAGATMAVEREWTKALSNGDSHQLASINAGMKRIDLVCLIASPIAVGLLMTWHIHAAVVVIVVYNLVVWVPENTLLKRALAASTALRAEKKPILQRRPASSNDLDDDPSSTSTSTRGWLPSFKVYAQQPCAPAAFSLALLYFTVMSFGTLTTAYLKWRGVQEAKLSIYRGCGALSGLLATTVFPPLERRLGLIPTGAASIWMQLACVLCAAAPAVLDVLSPGSIPQTAITLALVWGLVLSRFGLWSFDLAANQVIQELTDPGVLGQTTGAQSSLQSGFQMLAYAAGVVMWRPESFPWLMAGSCAGVALAAVIFTGFAIRTGCGRGGDALNAYGSSQPLSP